MNPLIQEAAPAARLAREICSAWLDGTPPDARAALEQHPALADDPSVVLDLVYAEFCMRREAGETIDTEAFCDAFPEVRAELSLLLCTDRAIAQRRSITRDDPAGGLTVWPAPGDEVGQCRLIRELGRGAFSRVYLAVEQSAGDRPVALKLCRAADVEARTLGRLHHDHVVPILWAGHVEAWALDAVCMPFLGSATLADIFDRLYPSPGSPPPREASAILAAVESTAQPGDPAPDLLLAGPDLRGRSFVDGVARLALPVAEALAFLHARGLYHCDIKPSNLLITPRGRPMLLDFNLSRAEGVTPSIVGGTFPYMAPEQLRVHAAGRGVMPQSAQADLFSLGVILYELLTGRPPFGRAPAEVKTKELPAWLLGRMPGGFVPIDRLNPRVPPGLAELIRGCLELDPARRPTSQQVVASLRPRAPRRGWVALAAACGLSAAAFGAVTGSREGKAVGPSPEPPPAVDVTRADRAAAAAALAKANRHIAAGQRGQAEADLKEASARLRRLLNQPGPEAAGAWKDHLNQAYALMLLNKPDEAHSPLNAAEASLRGELLRSATSALLPAAAGPLFTLPWLASWADTQDRPAQILACRAYCRALEGAHDHAILHGQKALDLGYQDARVMNNIGYSAMMANNPALARHHLGQAVCLAADLCPARVNAFQVTYKELLQSPSAAVPDYLLDELDDAIGLLQSQRMPGPAELYRLAGQVYARAALDLRRNAGAVAEMRRREQRAKEYVERACVLGLDPEQVARDDFLRQALGDEGLRPERLRALRTQDPTPVLSWYLADPLGGPVR
jgi:hypothetical protein